MVEETRKVEDENTLKWNFDVKIIEFINICVF